MVLPLSLLFVFTTAPTSGGIFSSTLSKFSYVDAVFLCQVKKGSAKVILDQNGKPVPALVIVAVNKLIVKPYFFRKADQLFFREKVESSPLIRLTGFVPGYLPRTVLPNEQTNGIKYHYIIHLVNKGAKCYQDGSWDSEWRGYYSLGFEVWIYGRDKVVTDLDSTYSKLSSGDIALATKVTKQ